MKDVEKIDDLSREELLELLNIYAKNWLAMDGLWFQSIEEKYGMEEAIFHDINMWRQFTVIEAKRLKVFLAIPEQSGLAGLKKALAFRLYAELNEQEFLSPNSSTLIYRVISCRVQSARDRKGMPFFPCKPVGLVEYTLFAQEIDSRFEVEALSCPPDITDNTCHCAWKFILKD